MTEVWVKTSDNRQKIRASDISIVGILTGGRDALVEVTALGNKHVIARKNEAVAAGDDFHSDKVLDVASDIADDFLNTVYRISDTGAAYYEIGFDGSDWQIL